MNKGEFSLAHICAYLSLAISLIILILWCCNVGGFTVISLDSFVGVIVALLAIIVTLAIAWQIFNSIELKGKVEELDDLKKSLCDLKEKNQEQINRINHLIYASMSETEIDHGNQIFAFYYLLQSLKYTMLLDKPINVNSVFERMAISIRKLKNDSKCDSLKKIQDVDDDIRKTKLYKVIEQQYDELYNSFISKVKESNDKK